MQFIQHVRNNKGGDTFMAIREAVGKVSIFGWLENLDLWKSLPYPVKGAVLRGLKAGLAVLVSALLVAATAGTLFPMAWGPVVIGLLTMGLQGVDKYIREWNISEEDKAENADVPTSEPVPDEPVDEPPVNTDATVPNDLPDDTGDSLAGAEDVNTDATVIDEPVTEPEETDLPSDN